MQWWMNIRKLGIIWWFWCEKLKIILKFLRDLILLQSVALSRPTIKTVQEQLARWLYKLEFHLITCGHAFEEEEDYFNLNNTFSNYVYSCCFSTERDFILIFGLKKMIIFGKFSAHSSLFCTTKKEKLFNGRIEK